MHLVTKVSLLIIVGIITAALMGISFGAKHCETLNQPIKEVL